jgi:phosphate starvation-inducible protein PhoH
MNRSKCSAPLRLRTRRKSVEPRTEAQKAYVANLFDHELAFGIGPAGTGKTYLAVAVGVTMLIGGRWTRSSCRAPRSRRASGWASCPAT